MKKQITHISIHQSSKVLSVFAVLIMTIFAIIPFALYAFIKGSVLLGLMALFLAPIFYGVLFYLLYTISFWFYNFIAKHLGGIEFQESLGEGAKMHGHQMDDL